MITKTGQEFIEKKSAVIPTIQNAIPRIGGALGAAVNRFRSMTPLQQAGLGASGVAGSYGVGHMMGGRNNNQQPVNQNFNLGQQ